MESVTGGTSVLIVEDDRKILRVFSTSLEVEGYRVADVGSGQRAIEEVRIRNPDIILLDLGLPDGDGLALVPTIRAHSSAPIINLAARVETGSTDRTSTRRDGVERPACSRPPRQDPQTVAKAAPACSPDAIKVALMRPGKVLRRLKTPFEMTMGAPAKRRNASMPSSTTRPKSRRTSETATVSRTGSPMAPAMMRTSDIARAMSVTPMIVGSPMNRWFTKLKRAQGLLSC